MLAVGADRRRRDPGHSRSGSPEPDRRHPARSPVPYRTLTRRKVVVIRPKPLVDRAPGDELGDVALHDRLIAEREAEPAAIERCDCANAKHRQVMLRPITSSDNWLERRLPPDRSAAALAWRACLGPDELTDAVRSPLAVSMAKADYRIQGAKKEEGHESRRSTSRIGATPKRSRAPSPRASVPTHAPCALTTRRVRQ